MSDPQDVGPDPVPVTAEQLAAGRDAVPALPDEAAPDPDPDPDEERRAAAESHDDAGPEQEQPE